MAAKRARFFVPDNDSNGAKSSKSSGGLKSSPSMATLNRLDRQTIVLWQSPFTTLFYAVVELCHKFIEAICWAWRERALVSLPILFFIAVVSLYNTDGAHKPYMEGAESSILLALYWCGLGVLSSIGLGTGLHTFILYLGPHIATVTLAAYECQSLDFPQPPYPQEIICPETASNVIVTIWAIMAKVRFEAFCWGVGTALGELPPYFMARTARLSGEEPDDEEYREFMQYMKDREDGVSDEQGGLWHRAKMTVEKLVEKVGFPGILLCASIPNPLFDLAGITCGHFLVPFWSFFTATLIGKAVVKMHIQMMFVILAFSEHYMDEYVALIARIPVIGEKMQTPFLEFLSKQKNALHKGGQGQAHSSSVLSDLFGYLVLAMVVYFLVSIINSLAQAYHARQWQKQKSK